MILIGGVPGQIYAGPDNSPSSRRRHARATRLSMPFEVRPGSDVAARETAVDVVVGDISIPKGAFLVLSLAAANRDPAVFADPDRLDIERPNAKAHLAFGAGFHVCLGQAVARVEARVAFETLLRRVKDIGLENEPTAREGLMFKGNYTLPIRYSVD